jgi:undecaprenyl-diphosphatase
MQPLSTAAVVVRPVLAGHVHTTVPATPSSVLLSRPRLVLVLAAVFAALALAAAMWGGQVLLTWDEPIQRGVEARRTSALDELFLTVSRFGSTIPVLVIGTLASIVTWRRCRAVGTVVLVATFSRPALEFIVKALVDRDRPDFDRLVAGNGPSFPAGHVMAAVALWGLMPLVVSLYTRRRAIWWASVAVAGALIAGIAASRIYLGVHWFSDVTGGLIVGAFFLLAVEAVLIRQHASHPCRLMGCSDDAETDPQPATGDQHALVADASPGDDHTSSAFPSPADRTLAASLSHRARGR